MGGGGTGRIGEVVHIGISGGCGGRILERFRSCSARISGMWWRGMPVATYRCVADGLTRTISKNKG